MIDSTIYRIKRGAMIDRREQLLNAAAKLWRIHGEAFTMDDLAAKSRVPRAALYRIFSKKAEILRALAQERGITELADEPPEIAQRIIEAARKIFFAEGIQASTLERVAEAAGVGVATVYRHFKDKAGLLRA